ncbi:MAG: hypothetical protein QOJ56_5287 [Mycobacterium sp.]|jgi:hypothetical protein|uniref:hypothetical protein n=1 Tax=Mycobacterium sp. TaxID=1785 RepID=UPI0028BB73B6|nr:hypothetical protein [Mycobacterium sp.]MDT5356755.1 hypothetical protein [Mycobacterium sp.]
MQHALRPYATAGVALVGASIIAVTPLAVPPPNVQVRPVQLVDAWSDLVTNTTANLDSIVSNADSSDISQVFSALLTNPLGVISALTNVDPAVTTTAGVPLTVGVELPPGLELALAQLGAEGATLDAINGVVGQLASDPSNAFNILYEGTATILNAGLNGADNVSLLGGIIDIPAFNGLLAPETSLTVDLNVTDLVNALGLGNLDLSSLDLSSLLSQLGLGDLTIGSLFSDLGLSGDGLGTLLGNPTFGTLLTDFGLGNLGLGNFSLQAILGELGLDTNVNLSNLTVTQVLDAFGLDSPIGLTLSAFLDKLGFSSFLDTGLGTELNDLHLLTGVLTDLNGVLGNVVSNPGVEAALMALGITPGSLLSLSSLETALNAETVGSLLNGQAVQETVAGLLGQLGISIPNTLSVATVLEDLGFSSSTGSLTLSQLLGDLGGLSNGILDTHVGSLLNTLDLGTLLTDLGISDTALNLTNLGDISGLTLDGLLGDLGLGDLATITVDPFGGLITELVDTVPAQILAAL